MNEVKCPNCKSRSWLRKGKSKDKQFQRLRCKDCGKNWSIESFIVNKQRELPEILFALVEHPDGMYSVNKIEINKTANKTHIRNVEFISSKVPTYEKVVELASKLALDIKPNVVKLDDYIPESLKNQVRILFPPDIANNIIKLMDNLCKELTWKK
jgi:transposase-like protein